MIVCDAMRNGYTCMNSNSIPLLNKCFEWEGQEQSNRVRE